jgi:large subunit ribosomal protein L35
VPKQKTHKAIASRVKITGTGKLLRRRAGKRHLMAKKSSKRKRLLGKDTSVFKTIAKTYKKLMGLSPKTT